MNEQKEVLHKAYVFDTPDGVELYRLASIKARLTLESKGLKSRFGSTRSKMATELGLKPRDSFQKYLDAIQVKIDALKSKMLKERMIVEERGTDTMVMSGDRSALVSFDLYRVAPLYRVVYYEAGTMDKPARAPSEYYDESAALDAAEAWVCEIR